MDETGAAGAGGVGACWGAGTASVGTDFAAFISAATS